MIHTLFEFDNWQGLTKDPMHEYMRFVIFNSLCRIHETLANDAIGSCVFADFEANINEDLSDNGCILYSSRFKPLDHLDILILIAPFGYHIRFDILQCPPVLKKSDSLFSLFTSGNFYLVNPLTFQLVHKSNSHINRQIEATQNAYLLNIDSFGTRKVSYFNNSIRRYFFDCCSRLSYTGFRFSNNVYADHLLLDSSSDNSCAVLLGGSAAFGIYTPDAFELSRLYDRTLLEQSNINSRAFNFSSPGLTLSSSVNHFIHEALPLKPDIVFALAGYNECTIPLLGKSKSNIYSNSIDDNMSDLIFKGLRTLEHESRDDSASQLMPNQSLEKLADLNLGLLSPESLNTDYLTENATYIIESFVHIQTTMHQLCSANGIRYVCLLQPLYDSNIAQAVDKECVEKFCLTSSKSKVINEKLLHLFRKISMSLSGSDVEFYDLNCIYPLLRRFSIDLKVPFFVDTCHFSFIAAPVIAYVMSSISLSSVSDLLILEDLLTKNTLEEIFSRHNLSAFV